MVIQDKPNQALGFLEPGGWFRKPASSQTHKLIWISPTWAQQHRDLEYHHESFNNNADITEWRRLGFSQQRFTGDLYDMRSPEPPCIAGIRDRLPLKLFSWSFYRMRPGDVLPNHSDTYAAFRRIHKLADDAVIRRYVIFLEDWQSGHYFEIDNKAVSQWVAGTAVLWHNDTPHLAANMGIMPRYTLQITGVIDFDNHPWQLQHFNDSIF